MHLSRDDERVARLIEQAIPDSLRLAKHPDAELVNLAIATVLLAVRDSHSFTLRGQRNDVRNALEGYFAHTFAPHIAQEDEDWSSMKARAASADEIRKELHTAIGDAVHAFKEHSEGLSKSQQEQYDRMMAAYRANPRGVVLDLPGHTPEDIVAKAEAEKEKP